MSCSLHTQYCSEGQLQVTSSLSDFSELIQPRTSSGLRKTYQAEQGDAGEAVAGQTLDADIHCHNSLHTCPERLCRSDCTVYD